MINLVVNAIKYNRRGGEVRIAVEPAGVDHVRISVTDTGNGIDEASLGKLFVPFERLDAARTGIEGTGLGLALSRGLVDAMGGTIGAASEPGVGSVFFVDLLQGEPRVVEELDAGDDELIAVRAYGGASGGCSTSRTRSRTSR